LYGYAAMILIDTSTVINYDCNRVCRTGHKCQLRYVVSLPKYIILIKNFFIFQMFHVSASKCHFLMSFDGVAFQVQCHGRHFQWFTEKNLRQFKVFIVAFLSLFPLSNQIKGTFSHKVERCFIVRIRFKYFRYQINNETDGL
jgi:hypothetical protein